MHSYPKTYWKPKTRWHTKIQWPRPSRAWALLTLSSSAFFAPISATWAQTTSSPGAVAASCSTPRRFDSFGELRNEVLDYLSGATQRLWLVTPYLTDGEIVSALYVAQYRKLDVKVLLGRQKANLYMSRLSYLKNQNIPVYLKPDSFTPRQPTVILADERLVYIDGELDFLAKYRRFNCSEGTKADAEAFVRQFAAAANLQVPAHATPLPLVGRPGAHPQLKVIRSRGEGPGVNADGSYTYSRSKSPKPAEVPTKLPKSTIWQQRAADRAAAQVARPATPDAAVLEDAEIEQGLIEEPKTAAP